MIYSVLGYYTTGSSAVFNLLSEYSTVSVGKFGGGDYEDVTLYTPDGLFDLEDKLLVGANIHRSDEAIRSFLKRMSYLDKNNFGWFGSQQTYFGDQFEKIYTKFADSLVEFSVNAHWQHHYEGFTYKPRRVAADILRKLKKENLVYPFGKGLVCTTEERILYAFPTADEFYEKARIFVKEYFEMLLGGEKKHLVLNQSLRPNNLYRVPNYFGEDFRAIVIDRDPRDVYMAINESPGQRIPVEVHEFVAFWKRYRATIQPVNDPRVVYLQFEDFIYRYDEAVAELEKACNLNSADHVRRQMVYSPTASKKNTQMFVGKPEVQEAIRYIEQELPEYLYDFSKVN